MRKKYEREISLAFKVAFIMFQIVSTALFIWDLERQKQAAQQLIEQTKQLERRLEQIEKVMK